MDSVPTIAAAPTTRQPDREAAPPPWPVPSLGTAVLRGLKCSCPACGKAKLFRGYLRVVDDCANCGAPLGSVRADDAPPYFTIFVVGHIVIPGMFMLDHITDLPDWVQAAIWVPITAILAVGLLRPIKGATVGLMLKFGLLKARDESDDA